MSSVNMIFTTNINNAYIQPKTVLKKASIQIKKSLNKKSAEIDVKISPKNIMMSNLALGSGSLNENYIYQIKNKNIEMDKNVKKSVSGTLASIFKNIQVKRSCRSCGGGFK